MSNMISMRVRTQYSSRAVAGARLRSEDIKIIGPRGVIAKINNSQSPSGFHSSDSVIT